ncbi:MAG: PEGA domain-containing protein [Blastocatellia bacterium]
MQKLNGSLFAVGATLLLVSLRAVSPAQERTLAEDEFYGDVKQVLMGHYTGKIVRMKLPIPATRRGLEMVDGALQNKAEKEPPPTAADPGDELTIKSFKVSDSSIEVLLAKNEPPPKRRVPNPFSPWRQPRINMRFTRELNVKDLTIENINRLLDPAVDVTTLIPLATESPASSAPAIKADASVNPQTMPTPDIVGDLPGAGLNVGELSIECSAPDARVYIDGAYSGAAPRTIRLRAGIHTILVVKEGFASWEQRLFIPGAKLSRVRAELRR